MFITIIEKEQINNLLKVSLSKIPNPNFSNFFSSITQKNYIDLNDLKQFLELNSIKYNEQIIRRFIHIFDKHNNFCLIYEDFLKIFEPYSQKEINDEYNLMKEKDIELNVMINYLELIEQINEMIINIRNTNNFTTYEAFMGITKGNKYLDEEFLIHFLEHHYSNEEIKNLIYLFDMDNDNLISYDEFQDFFIPLLQYINKKEEIYNNEINVENNDIVNFEKSGKCIINKNTVNNNLNNNENNNNNEEIENKEEINENNNDNIQIENNENIDMNEDEQKNNEIIENNHNINNLEDDKKLNISKEEEKNDNYEINLSSDDYDNYCNFYRKTRQILSSSSKKNEINDNKNSENENPNFNKIKNIDIPVSEKEKELNNINNFTCREKTESEKGNSSPKKIILNINSNDLENYSLSNDYNNNIISKDNTNNKNILSDCNILSSNNEFNNISKEHKSEINKSKENINKSISNFIKYIQFLLIKEKHTLDLKDNLSLREDISLKNLFCIFDYNKKNKISKKEFKVVCKKIFGLYPTSDQINLVYKRYDKDKDNNLNIKEFLNMIKPIKEEYVCLLFNKEKNENDNNINMKSKKMFSDVIRAIIEDEGNYYKFKYDLENKNLFELNEFWNEIKNYFSNENGIDKLEFNKLLNDFGCNLNQYDIDIIFNKIDYDKDDIISYDDLTQEFLYYY